MCVNAYCTPICKQRYATYIYIFVHKLNIQTCEYIYTYIYTHAYIHTYIFVSLSAKTENNTERGLEGDMLTMHIHINRGLNVSVET